MTSTPTNTRPHRKERVGEVIESKMAKTIIVRVKRRYQHTEFKKIITAYKKYYVHDEKGEAKAGDQVLIQESRPLSKLKRWRLVQVIERNKDSATVNA